ncbi:sugar ABC transporter ATP-binding protein [Paracoccus suum]|uniref:Sugar ABC transporter ATP-binding protein n=1 Tax=Paracoccus suum TaxID=2259340 RepID=A0A344PJM8_9RHOB|nr:sugar ABC transporter ATP-binding protein [Paracoccus suum]AXC49583.1 sugar ABC transporter ATP-binding protein [Paracoccus suum]
MSAAPILALTGVRRSFGPVEVLHGVDLPLLPGEVHALIGENGAGKSTAMRILAGYLPPSAGEVRLAGAPVAFSGAPQAEAAGIVMIHQEFNLAPDLSIAANIYLGREIGGWRLDHQAMRDGAARLLADLGTPLDPRTRIQDLTVPQRQMVEIAKAVSRAPKVLIMDEPSAVLTHREVGTLYDLIDRLRGQGVAILYCSHRLDEVERLADRITVLRDGTVVRSALRGELTPDAMANAMVGRELEDMFPPRPAAPTAPEIALSVRDLSVPPLVSGASFDLHRGEMLGIAGLVGAGRTELAEALAGLRPAQGVISRGNGRAIPLGDPAAATRARIAYLTEDRKEAGLLLGKSLRVNLTLAALHRFGRVLIDRPAEDAALARAIRDFDIRAADPTMTAGNLSGGNQQKLLLAKMLLNEPEVIIVDEPTRGIDVGTKRQIYSFLRGLTAAGRSVIVISSELPEVMGLADRILVMRQGRIAGEVPGAGASEAAIVRLMMGVEGAAA